LLGVDRLREKRELTASAGAGLATGLKAW
jgi:hypothetical protein